MADTQALLAERGPLAADAERVRAAWARLEAALSHAEPEGAQAVGVAEARALLALVAVAEGDLATARAAAGDPSRAQSPAQLALRGALEQDPARASHDLQRAIDGGVARVDLLAWRARVRSARGPGAADAPGVLADLEAVEQVRPLGPEEVGWRALA